MSGCSPTLSVAVPHDTRPTGERERRSGGGGRGEEVVHPKERREEGRRERRGRKEEIRFHPAGSQRSDLLVLRTQEGERCRRHPRGGERNPREPEWCDDATVIVIMMIVRHHCCEDGRSDQISTSTSAIANAEWIGHDWGPNGLGAEWSGLPTGLW